MKLFWGTLLVVSVPMVISFISVHLTFKSIKEISLLQKALLSLLVIFSIGIPWTLASLFAFEDKFITAGAFLILFGLSILFAGHFVQKIISKSIETTYKNSLKIYTAIFARVFVGLAAIVLVVKPLMMLTKNI
jgi:nitrate reductase gamma subunit